MFDMKKIKAVFAAAVMTAALIGGQVSATMMSPYGKVDF